MKRIYVLITSILLLLIGGVYAFAHEPKEIDYFEYASKQLQKYHPARNDYVIIIDYRKSIVAERLYVLDMKHKNIVIQSNVSHAFKSGLIYATTFSNTVSSNTSCKGNFVTGQSTYGKYGYSMLVHGLDKGINDRALERAIIFHPDTKMKSKWSWGCFATPEDVNKRLIDLTKKGVLVCVITN